jgi:glycosyltransferase involved in cell wall biosynthesis
MKAGKSMQTKLKISVITATYNCAEFLPDCLLSVSNQCYQNIEHIVIDGASKDDTPKVIEQYKNGISTYICEKDLGIYDALNKGISLATGDIVGFLHADDMYASDEVVSTIAKAFEDSSVCAVYGDLLYVKRLDTHKVIRRWHSQSFNEGKMTWGWMPAHPTLYLRRNLYLSIGGFDISYRISADYLSILQLFLKPKFKVVYLPQVLVLMRLGGSSNKSLRAQLNKTKEDWRALRSSGFGLIISARALAWKNLSKLPQFW